MKYLHGFFLLIALTLGFQSTVTAQTGNFTWGGVASSNWTSTTNWAGTTSGGVPLLLRFPGVHSVTGSGNNVNDLATFTNGVGSADIGIAFPGTLSVGAINLASGSRNIGNSSAATSGTLTLNGAGSGFSVAAKTLLSVGTSGSTLRVRDVASGAGTQTMSVNFGISDGIIDIVTGSSVIIDSVIKGGNGFIKSGGGSLRLTGENTFNGLMTINAGTVQVGQGGQTGRISGNVQINGGALEFNNGASTGFSRTFGGDTAGVGSVNHGGTAGPGSESLLQVTGAWSHAGGTTIAGGNGVLSIGNGGMLGSIVGNIAITNSTANLRFNKSDSLTYNGQVSGSGGVQQVGSGSTILTNSSSYSGQTVVSNGSLTVNGTLSNTNVTVASISNASTLGGTGEINGAVLIGANGTLSPGDLAPGGSLGNLKTGNLSFLNDSTFKFEFNSITGSSDWVNVNGNLSLTGDVALQISDLGSSMSRFSLISYRGTWNGGVFQGLDNLDRFSIGGRQWQIRYDDVYSGVNGGMYSNFVTISAVPEPSSLAMLSVVSAIPLVGRYLKRKRTGKNTDAASTPENEV